MAKEKNNKKDYSGIILAAVFLVGLSVLLYPSLSNYWNSRVQSKAIVDYEAAVGKMTDDEKDAVFKEAEEYNLEISRLSSPFSEFAKIPNYDNILNIGGNGIIGYISIDKIRVELPIYHGTGAAVLNVAAGHLKGSAFPVGGDGTHSVISAHRGLPSARLFTDLDKLSVGDTFTVTVLDRTVTYEVDRILTVEPEEVEALYAEEGEDYCTLLTCTPYGINTHRMLVRGKRIENIEGQPVVYVTADAFVVDPIIVTPAVAMPILIALLIFLIVKHRKKEKKGNEKDS